VNFHKLINEIYDIFEHFEDLSLNLKTQQINMNVQKEATKTHQYSLAGKKKSSRSIKRERTVV
jgi:hypothetical protein